MNISTTPELEKFVKAEDKMRVARFMMSSKPDLETKLLEGIAELDGGEGLPGEQVFAELKAHSAKRRRDHV